MSIAPRLQPFSRFPKKFNGFYLILAPAIFAALAIGACTGHSDKAEVAAAASADADGKTRSPASADGKQTADSLASFTEATAGNHKKGHGKNSGKDGIAHHATENVYVVQIGAFRVKENAEKLNQKLKSEGYPVVVQALDHSSNGQLFLVRLNPMTDRHEAENMRMNLKAKIDIDSMVIALPKNEREVSSVGGSVHGPVTGTTATSTATGATAADIAHSEIH